MYVYIAFTGDTYLHEKYLFHINLSLDISYNTYSGYMNFVLDLRYKININENKQPYAFFPLFEY